MFVIVNIKHTKNRNVYQYKEPEGFTYGLHISKERGIRVKCPHITYRKNDRMLVVFGGERFIGKSVFADRRW